MKSSYDIFNVVKKARLHMYTFYVLDGDMWEETKWCLNDKNEANREFAELIDRTKTSSLFKVSHVIRGWL